MPVVTPADSAWLAPIPVEMRGKKGGGPLPPSGVDAERSGALIGDAKPVRKGRNEKPADESAGFGILVVMGGLEPSTYGL